MILKQENLSSTIKDRQLLSKIAILFSADRLIYRSAFAFMKENICLSRNITTVHKLFI